MSNYAFVIMGESVFGGAERRFINLFFFLRNNSDNNYFLITTSNLFNRIRQIYPSEIFTNILIINNGSGGKNSGNAGGVRSFPVITDNYIFQVLKKTLFYKLYYFYKHRSINKAKYKKIESLITSNHIITLLGVFDGIFPLYHYLNKKKRPGIIFCNMDSWFSNLSEKPEQDWYRKYVLFNFAHQKADLIDFLSPFIFNGIKKLGIVVKNERIRITPCSFTDYNKCFIGNKQKMTVSYASRLEGEKNPILFTQVAADLGRKFPEVEFHIMGEGNLGNEINSIIKDYTYSNIIFHGFHPHPETVFKESSVFISIQSTNNYPSQSVLEAMACGNAIIATDVGDTRMFVNDNNGTLISLEYSALKDTIEYYILNPLIAKSKGLYAAKFVKENHTIEKTSKYYESIFREASGRSV